jgi:hypothetical protein
MGNSEVGHTNIGAGRVVFQDLPKITRDIETGDFFKNPAYVKAMDDALKTAAKLCTFWASCPTAACTATSSTSSPCWTWQGRGAEKRLRPLLSRRAGRAASRAARAM